jgi:hypothetical protein
MQEVSHTLVTLAIKKTPHTISIPAGREVKWVLVLVYVRNQNLPAKDIKLMPTFMLSECMLCDGTDILKSRYKRGCIP